MNKNPYDVLGVSPNASDDEIKRAYRDLTRKYHPDANVNNPLADLAEEKFKEVQEAYDTIMRERSSGSSGSGGAATPMMAVLRTAERQAGHMADMRAHSRIPAFRQRRTISTADATGRL